MTFKKSLTDHFKKFSASPFLFVGSGMSRRYLGAENWEELLKRFCGLIGGNYTKIRSQADGDLMKIASILAQSYSDKWWDSDIKGDKEERYTEHLLKKDSPLKIEISDYLKDIHKNTLEEYQAEIELLASSKIDGIITTNWDLFLESIFSEFSVFVGQDGLFSSRNHGIAEIYKIHGCASEPNSLILTSQDYELFRKKNPYLSSKLLTIFIEHPIIFLGYSLTDPHILEILEEIVECFPESKMDALKENIIFVEWSADADEPVLTESIILKTLPVKLIKASSYMEIFEVLSEVKRRIPAHIFRQIKDELYELVVTNDPKGKLYVKDVDDLDGAEQGESVNILLNFTQFFETRIEYRFQI
ncbi:SIR2 family protein, partial [Aeromonas rivipollensis]|uniref:SIR2 family protein n=1 Tax=Aeromonas rivipollensis TaxID=948519 RepID=UPI003D1E5936